jgi:uncharacterized protein (TIGR03083 family)
MDSVRSSRRVDHRTALAEVTTAMTAALETAPPGIRTSGLPRWTAHDVGAHLTGVHRWAAQIIRSGTRAGRTNLPELAGPTAEEYRAAATELLDVLAGTDPDRSCWTLDRSDRRVGFWARRQLHEALVHLWDVRSTAVGTPLLPDVPPERCADGVDEFLHVFPPRIGPAARRPLPGPLLLRATDTPAGWWLAPDWVVHPEERDAAATVQAPAGALLLFAWGRPITSEVELTGEPSVVHEFLRAQCRA